MERWLQNHNILVETFNKNINKNETYVIKYSEMSKNHNVNRMRNVKK